MKIESINGDNFDGVGHELTAGFVAGLLMDALNARAVYDDNGRATVFIDIPVPDDTPFPVDTIRVAVVPPEKDFGPAEIMDSIAKMVTPIRRIATEAAMRTDLYELAERQREEEREEEGRG